MSYQELEPVILRKKQAPSTFQRAPNAKKFDNLLSDEPAPVKTIGSEMGKKLQQARTTKKMTQVQLARALNVRESVIKDYEQGIAVYDGALLARIKRHLSI